MLELCLRGTLVAAASLGVASLVGRRSPALRHLVLCLGFGWLVLMPVQSAMGPRWRPAVLPSSTLRSPEGTQLVWDLAALARSGALPAADPAGRTDGSPSPPAPLPLGSIAFGLALAGTILLLGIRVGGMVSIDRLIRRGRPLGGADPVWRTAHRAGRRVGLIHPIRLVESAECATPFAAGLFRPVIVVPAEFGSWPAPRAEAVLLHEAAHVARRDPWWRVLGEVALAVHWWNPVVRRAVRAGVTASELAADDHVVAAGVAPERYAGDLVGLFRAARGRPLLAPPVLHLSRSDLDVRVTRLLAPRSPRPASRVMRAVTSVAAAVLLTGAATLAPRRSPAPGSPESTLNFSTGGPDVSSNAAGVQARWVANGRNVGIFLNGRVDLTRLLGPDAPSGAGSLVVIEEWGSGVRTYRWPEGGRAPTWVRDVLDTAAGQLADLPMQAGRGQPARLAPAAPVTSAAPRPRRPGSSLIGLPAFSSDPGTGVVQAGWIDGGRRYGFFLRGRWSESGDTVVSSGRPAWIHAFRYDPVTETIDEVTIAPDAGGNPVARWQDGVPAERRSLDWVAGGVRRIGAIVAADASP